MQNNNIPQLALARPMDVSYRTNLIIIILTPVLGIIAGLLTLLTGGDLGLAINNGFWIGATTFISWVIAREVDPEHDYSAFLAVLFAVVASALLGVPSLELFLIAFTIPLTRMINRVVGVSISDVESIIVLFFTVFIAFQYHGLFALIVALAFYLDGAVLSNPRLKQRSYAIAMLMVAFPALMARPLQFAPFDLPTIIIALALMIPFLITAYMTSEINTETDIGGVKINANRVQAEMALFALVPLVSLLLYGQTGMINLLPLWAIMIAVPVYRLGYTVFANSKK